MNQYADLPEGREDSVHPGLWSNKIRVSLRFQHRCNTDRPVPGAGHCPLLPVCPREGLKNTAPEI